MKCLPEVPQLIRNGAKIQALADSKSCVLSLLPCCSLPLVDAQCPLASPLPTAKVGISISALVPNQLATQLYAFPRKLSCGLGKSPNSVALDLLNHRLPLFTHDLWGRPLHGCDLPLPCWGKQKTIAYSMLLWSREREIKIQLQGHSRTTGLQP